MTDRLWARIEGVLGAVQPVARDITTNLVMEIVQPIADERDRLAAELEENVGVLKALRRQRDQAEAAVERVRVVHHRVECSNVHCKVGGWCIGCDPDGADGCSEHPWPCPTVIAVSPDGEIPTLYAQWVLRRDHDAVKAERDALRMQLRDAEAQRDSLVVNEESDSYLIGRKVASAGMYNTVLRRAMKAEAERDGRREVERSQAEAERDRLAAQVAELEQRQADHLAEINQTTNQLNAVHATAIEWSEHCPPNNEGMHPTDMILANAGRYLIALIDEAAQTTLDNPLTSTNTVDNPKEQP